MRAAPALAAPEMGVARAVLVARTESGRSNATRTTSGASNKSDYASAAEDVPDDAQANTLAALGEAVPFQPMDEDDELGGAPDLPVLDDAEPIGNVIAEAVEMLEKARTTDDNMLDISKEADQGDEQIEAAKEPAAPQSVLPEMLRC